MFQIYIIQGVLDLNLSKEKAITLKRSIFDPTMVKTKCVSGPNNFFTSTSYLFKRNIKRYGMFDSQIKSL